MQIVQSPATVEKLALLLGEPTTAPVIEPSLLPANPPPAIDQALLESIEDNTTFRDEESAAWFHLLDIVRTSDSQQFASASLGEIAYAQLLNQPEHYRGRVVRIDGNARRVEQIAPAANDHGIDTLFRIIIQPSRDLLRPFTLYCLELPAGWSVGDQLPNNGRLSVDGLFFKNWVYNNSQGVDLSPVFVSRSLAPISAPHTLVDRTPPLPAWQLIALALLAAAVAVVWVASRNTGAIARRYAADSAQVASDLQSLTLEDNTS